MQKNWLISFCLLLICSGALAQYDAWLGTWQMEYRAAPDSPVIFIELKIGYSEKGILYPAAIKLKTDSFYGSYELLLVRKNSRQLAISRNKYAVTEKPFSLGESLLRLNGLFDMSRDINGQPTLTVNRMLLKQNPLILQDSISTHIIMANRLFNCIEHGDIVLSKHDGIPWKEEDAERILSPSFSPVYFGLLDTIYVPTRDVTVHLSSQNKNDIVSLAGNGKMYLEQMYLSKKDYADDALLDTGVTIVVLFAENFNEALPNKGKVNFEFGRKKLKLGFDRKDDSAANFIAVKMYYEHDKSKDNYFSDYNINDLTLKENEKLIGSVKSVSQQITLALWDDAVEDGDSISININDQWITRGFPVKKHPQFLTVTLKPGANTITFIGDNLGSIPPNTSVLEIIDGKRRKSFLLETVPGENNLLKIFYDSH